MSKRLFHILVGRIGAYGLLALMSLYVSVMATCIFFIRLWSGEYSVGLQVFSMSLYGAMLVPAVMFARELRWIMQEAISEGFTKLSNEQTNVCSTSSQSLQTLTPSQSVLRKRDGTYDFDSVLAVQAHFGEIPDGMI